MSRVQKIRTLELAGVIVLFSILFLFLAGGHHPAAAAERESGSGYTAWISGKDISVNKSGINTIEKSYYSRDLNKKAMKIYKALYKKSGKSGKKVKVKLAKKITVKLSKSAFKAGKLNDQKKVDATWGDEGKTASLRWFMYGQNEVKKNNKKHPGDSDYMFGDESYDFAIPALEPLGIGYSGK